MDSLQFALSPSEVTTHVFGAVQGPISIAARAALGELFVAGRFEHLYMRPENYVFAEDYGEDDPNLPLNLRVVIRVNGGGGVRRVRNSGSARARQGGTAVSETHP